MTDQEREGFRGPVQTAEREIHSSAGVCRDSWRFDRAGRLLERGSWSPDGSGGSLTYRYDRHGELVFPEGERKEVRRHADGGRTEIQTIPGVENLWLALLPKLNDVEFPTRGASKLEMTYDRRGFFKDAVFYDDAGGITTQVEFETDSCGNVIRATRYTGIAPLIPLELSVSLSESDRQNYETFVSGRGIEVDMRFRYDEASRLIEMVSSVGGNLTNLRITYTYNNYGDVLTRTLEASGTGAERSEYRYEYDAHGNWTRQVCAGSSDETRRAFTYYD